MRIPILIAWVAVGAALLTSQTPIPQPGEVRIQTGAYSLGTKLSVQTDLVEVGVTVRDRHGAAVAGLQASDFELFDNRTRQAIKFFSEQKAPQGAESAHGISPASQARSIALFFDDTHAGAFEIEKDKVAAAKFVADGLQAGDRIAVFTDSGNPTLDFTADRKALLDAIDRLRQHHRPGPASLGVCPDFSPYAAFAISHHADEDLRQRVIQQAIACNCQGAGPECPSQQPAVVDSQATQFWSQFKWQSAGSLDMVQTIIRHLATAPGSRILLLLSPGFVTGDLDARKSSILDDALRAHIVINALNPSGLQTMGRGNVLVTSAFMADSASATGGQFIQNRNDIPEGLNRLVAIPEISYLLGFSPGLPPDNKFHQLKVSLAHGQEYQVNARTGYFSAPAPQPKQTAQERIDSIVRSPAVLDEIPSHVEAAPTGAKNGSAKLQIKVAVDAAKLRFVQRGDRYVQQLTFVTVLEDAAGTFLMGNQSVMDLELSPSTLAAFKATGLKTSTSFTVAPGTYRVREVVREAADNRIAASRTPVEIR